MEGVPDDEISLSVLFYFVYGCSTFVVLGLSFMVAVGMVSWAGVGDHRWEKKMHFLEPSVFWQFVFRYFGWLG
jgi:hypothetical protein